MYQFPPRVITFRSSAGFISWSSCERGEVYHGNYFTAAAQQLNGPVVLQNLSLMRRTPNPHFEH